MPQVPADKVFFAFGGGLNTEASPLAFPEGVSLDEENFELKLNGTRRRRRGLSAETGHGADLTASGTYLNGMTTNTYRWTDVGGNPDLTFIVLQVGSSLLFMEEGATLSTGIKSSTISLVEMGTASEALIYTNNVSFASGRGRLLIAGRYLQPCYVQYDPDTDLFSLNGIGTWTRDFAGIDDGVELAAEQAALTDDNLYNLVNRGWTADLLATHVAGSTGSVYPAKNMIWWRGNKRLTQAGFETLDGIPQFDPLRLQAETFSDSDAPQGHLVLDPFTPSSAKIASGVPITVSSWSYTDLGNGYWEIDLTTSAVHGLIADDPMAITLSQFTYYDTGGSIYASSLNGGYYVISAPSTTRVTFLFKAPTDWGSWANQYVQKGYLANEAYFRSDVYSTQNRPTAVAFHASRAWWAGTPGAELNDTVFFSQIAVQPDQFGNFYQKADPTSQYINALESSDGGTIVVPGMGTVYKMLTQETSLLLFCSNGIWEILPGQSGFFQADGYKVRKVTSVPCLGYDAVTKIDSTIVFTSIRGIYVLGSDPQTGQITAQSMSETSVQSLWNDIPDARKEEVMLQYDDTKRRLYILYGDDDVTVANTYNRALVFDVGLKAFYKLKFSHSNSQTVYKICAFVATGFGNQTDEPVKMKFFILKDVAGTATLNVCDMNHSDFADFDGTEQECYLLTGYDNLGDFSRHRQAPTIHVFMHKTETGYEEAIDGALTPLGDSSCWMQARWDWSDSSTAGKWGTEQQVYRHVRYYQPTGTSDTFDSGYPVLVTRNKIRGRGRCLHLKFRADTGKDCYILGWAIEYKGERKQ